MSIDMTSKVLRKAKIILQEDKFHSSIYEGRKKDLRNIETNYNNKLN